MGGFPTVKLNADLMTRWREILEAHGMNVRLDEEEEKRHAGEPVSKRVLERAWLVSDGITELHVLEATIREPDGEEFLLIFFTYEKGEERLTTVIQEILIASGASNEKRKRRK